MSERITIPDDLSPFARRTERELEAAETEKRALVPLDRVPCAVVSRERLQSLPLDSRDGFVMSLVDGGSTVEDIVDLAGLPQGETIEILTRLLLLGAIELG